MAETAKKTTTAKKRAAKKPADAKRLTVTLTKSTIGFNNKQWLVVESLGLRRINHTIDVADTPAVRGMIHKVRHLLTVTGDK
jgi:large subunit ribosomal protein L30